MQNTNQSQPHPTEPEPLRRLASSAELRQIIPVGRTKFYETIRRDDFPAPIQLTPGGDYLWFLHEVYDWLEGRRLDPSQPRARPVRRPERAEEDGDRAGVKFRVVADGERRDSQPPRDLPDVEFRQVTHERDRAA